MSGIKSEVLTAHGLQGLARSGFWLPRKVISHHLPPGSLGSCHTGLSSAVFQCNKPAPTSNFVFTAQTQLIPSASIPYPLPSTRCPKLPYGQAIPDQVKLALSKWQPYFHFLTLASVLFFSKALIDPLHICLHVCNFSPLARM